MGYQNNFYIIDYMSNICCWNPINCLDFQKRQMLSEYISLVSQLFVNIWTYDHPYTCDGPTTFMHLCKKKTCEYIKSHINKLVFIPSTIASQITQNLILI